MQNKIRIVFICGSLEPGRDGVGDYVRKLAAELIHQGHSVKGIAINDSHISDVNQQDENLPVYRLPSVMPEAERVRLAKIVITAYQPDWVSLQFVIFSYHKKGLPFSISRNLATIGKSIRWHIMFHELYVGMYKDASMQHKLWGLVQRRIINKLVTTLKPKAVSTQNSVYQTILQQNGIPSFHLPLFGNITKNTTHKAQHVRTSQSSVIRIVSFGTIHPDSLIDQFASKASEYSLATQSELRLILVGRCGAHQHEFLRIWKSYGLTAEVLGEQPEEVISETLSKATFGISTTKLAMIEKSGTVAAMIEHGLPVLCIATKWERKGIAHIKTPTGIFQYPETDLKSFIEDLDQIVLKPQLIADIASELVRNLKKES